MNALNTVKSVAQVVSAVVDVGESQIKPNGVRVRVLWIPIYDSGWAGVKRREARRAARRG